jgi:carboxylesterase type B
VDPTVQDARITFLRGDDPWAVYEDKRRTTMLLNPESRTVDGYRREQLSLWNGRHPAAG